MFRTILHPSKARVNFDGTSGSIRTYAFDRLKLIFDRIDFRPQSREFRDGMGPKSKGYPMQKNWVLNWVIAPSVWLPSLAFAVPVNLTCTTAPLTTSVAIFTRGSDITFRVINHNGTDYIPIARNNVTPNDLTKLAQKAKDLVQLGAQYDHDGRERLRL
jgi:hypothetical protein